MAGQKKHNSSKFKDASTSPKSNSPLKAQPPPEATCRSPKMEASTDTKFDFNCSPKTESHYRRLSTLSINSGSAAGSRHVATSPMKHAPPTPSPKVSPQKLTPVKTPDHQQQQRTLEKSNSLGDSKPPRLLRNTRSLSPRPPVRHQHSIMVSDENDIISVKLSPNEEFEDDGCTRKVSPAQKDTVEGYGKDAKSDPPSMASEVGLKLSTNSSNNRSTSCLVYVPSDPWTRMDTASNSPSPATSKQEKSKTLDNSGKSYGKASSRFDYMKQTDPWVWRSNVNLPASGGGGGGKGTGKKRNVLTHQTKSLTAPKTSRDDCELGSKQHQPAAKLCQQQSLGRIDKTRTIPGVDGTVSGFDARKKITRPKLQRSKSPSFYEDFFQQPPSGGSGDSNKSPSSVAVKGKSPVPPPSKMEKNASNSTLNGHGTNNNNNNGTSTSNSGSFSSYNGSGSPTARKQPSPKLSFLSSTPQSPGKKPNHQHQPGLTSDPMGKTSLNLLAPNHLQPRHSFSTPSQKDDELQLNIRRLSEQMNKYSHSAGFPSPPAFLNDTILQQHHQQPPGVAGGNKKLGGSGTSLGIGSSVVGLGEAASQRKTASHSKINEPILETRC